MASAAFAAYWSRELSQVQQEEIEDHIFECDACAAAWQRAAVDSPCLSEIIRPILTTRH